jgi:hypothetical protein
MNIYNFGGNTLRARNYALPQNTNHCYLNLFLPVHFQVELEILRLANSQKSLHIPLHSQIDLTHFSTESKHKNFPRIFHTFAASFSILK